MGNSLPKNPWVSGPHHDQKTGFREFQSLFAVGGTNQIVYSSDPGATNSMNEGVSVVDDGEEMLLKSSGMSSMIRPQQKDRLKSHDAAELFWGLLTWRLQQ
jgi:hypothetical protein